MALPPLGDRHLSALNGNPSGIARPLASNLNVTAVGQNIPNLTITALGADGGVSLYSQGGTHLVADIDGYYLSE